jgi:hypothetical protein
MRKKLLREPNRNGSDVKVFSINRLGEGRVSSCLRYDHPPIVPVKEGIVRINLLSNAFNEFPLRDGVREGGHDDDECWGGGGSRKFARLQYTCKGSLRGGNGEAKPNYL